jgi:hypothetical protein
MAICIQRTSVDCKQYPNWRCEVHEIKMTVRYGFDEPS